MNIPGFKMPVGDIIVSKAMIAGVGSVGFGVYLILKGSQDFGWGAVLYGFSVLGIRDKL